MTMEMKNVGNVERFLGRQMERKGNWRFRAMLAAALPWYDVTPEDIGEAMLFMEENKEVKRHHLSKREDYDPTAPEGLKFKTLAANPDRRIRPLAAQYGDDDYNEPTYARELAEDTSHWDVKQLERGGVGVDEYMGRMLVSTTTQEKDVLWREQLLDTVVQGAEEVQFAREATNFVEVNTQQGDHPVRGDDVFAPAISQGGQIEFDELDWDQQSWNTEKHGLGAYITEELNEQSIVELIEENIRYLGRAVENGLNRLVLNALIDNAGQTVSKTTSATDGIQNANLSYVFDAAESIISNNFPAPDWMVMHPQFHLGFIVEDRNNVNFANRSGGSEYIRDGALPDVGTVTNNVIAPSSIYDGSNTYAWSGSSNDRGAVVYTKDLMFSYMYRDLETKDFEDPIRDLEGANVRAQYDAALGQTGAATVIDES